jgi:hypothetical protein
MLQEVYTEFLNHGGPEHLGYIPSNLAAFANPGHPAAVQLHDSYPHGGGWQPMDGWTYDPSNHSITYPEDPPLLPRARIRIGQPGEQVFVYDYGWVAVIQPNGEFQVARMD